MRCEHYAEVKAGGFLVDSEFQTIPDIHEMWEAGKPQYDGGCINHYWPKSFEEFAIKKARGQTLDLEVNSYDRPFTTFFDWNGHESADNHFPVDPTMLDRVKRTVEELRRIEGVGALADQIDRQFQTLVEHHYGDRQHLRDIYEEHSSAAAKA